MTNQKNRPMDPANLRQKAEALARERTVRTPEDSAALSPEEIRKTLHELRVHQIELEMQNEELRTAQAEIEAGRARYFDLYDLAPVGYLTLSEKGLILEANMTAATLLGQARGVLVKKPISRVILKEDQDIYYLHRKKLFETHSTGSGQACEPQECELRLLKPDGALIWAHLTGTVAQTEDGTPVCRLVIIDITERKKAEAALRESERKYRNLVENANEAIFVVQDQKIVFFNPITSVMSGYSADELLARPFIEFVLQDDREMVLDQHDRRFKGEIIPHLYSFRIVHKDGSIIWGELKAVLINWNGKPATLNFISDITERRRMEEALLESEATVRNKLKAILEPESDLGVLELADIVDIPAVQSLLENFHRITGMGSAIVDNNGKVLVGVGWQDICTKFHRCHPETLKNCLESDAFLAHGAAPGTFKSYLCKNGMNDLASPIEVAGRHIGNIYFGQFIYAGEEPDVEQFRQQSRLYGFDEGEYLAALNRVPRYDRETVDGVMDFYSKLAGMISSLSFSTVSLARALVKQQKAEEALREKTQLLQNIFDTISDLVAVTDMEGNYKIIGPSHSILGYDLDSLVGRNVMELVHPDDYQETATVFADFLANREDGRKVEYRYRRNDGEYLWFETIGKFILDEKGDQQEILFNTRDITERKRVEEEREKLQSQLFQSQKMESIGILAGGIAHDFNNLLHAMGGNLELLDMKIPDDHSGKKRIHTIQKSMDRATQLVKKLLLFTRKADIQTQVLDLNLEIHDAAKLLERSIPKMVNIELILDENARPINADPIQVEQMLLNLGTNAADVMPDGGRLIIETTNVTLDQDFVRTHAGGKPGKYVLMTVSDTGCGMDKETLQHIFDPFFTTKEVGKGTGLGLASAYGIVKAHEGYITCYSEVGQGTTFKIYLPVAEPGMAAPDKKESMEEVSIGGPETILIVDDDDEIRDLTHEILEDSGYRVLGAASGEQALEMFKEKSNDIDLVLMDLNMPGMGGGECTRQMLSIDPSVKILVASGYSANGHGKEALEFGARDFISKPYQVREILAKIREVLDGE